MLREFGNGDDPALRERVGAGVKKVNGRYYEAFAVEAGEELVGCLSLYQRTASTVSLGVEIFTAHRGKGHGTRAVAEGLRIAKERGFSVAVDQVNTDNLPSLAIHRKAGFECDGYVYKNRMGHDVCLWIKVL